MKNNNFTIVEQEVREAYADSWLDWEEGSRRRNLDFRASYPVTVNEAIKIFKRIDKNFTYNNFEPSLLIHLGENTLITIAREGSVCIYAHTEILPKSFKALLKSLEADEFDKEDRISELLNTWRIWWD